MFGSTSPFGSQSVFGRTDNTNNNPFALTGSSLFGGTSTGIFGQAQSTPFGASSFGNTSALGGASSSSGVLFGTSLFDSTASKPANMFGGTTNTSPQGTMTFGTTNTSPFGSTGSALGKWTFDKAHTSAFGGQRVGTRAAAYTSTACTDDQSGSVIKDQLQSISAMPVYKEKSHEELRWEDHQSGDKESQTNPLNQPPSSIFNIGGSSITPFTTTGLGNTSSSPFSSISASSRPSSTPFGQPTSPFSFPNQGSSPAPSTVSQTQNSFTSFGTSSSPFGSKPATNIFPSTPFGQPTSPFSFPNQGSSPASSTVSQTQNSFTSFGTSSSPFGSKPATNIFPSTPFGQPTSPFSFPNQGSSPASSTVSQTQNSFTSFGTSSSPFGSKPATNIFPSTPFGQPTSPFSFPNQGSSPASSTVSQTQNSFTSFGTSSSPFGSKPATNIFPSTPFGQPASPFSFPNQGSSPAPSTVPQTQNSFTSLGTSSSPFGSKPATNTTPFGQPISPFSFPNQGSSPAPSTVSQTPFGQNSSPFGTTNLFGNQTNIFATCSALGSSSSSTSNQSGPSLPSLTSSSVGSQPLQTDIFGLNNTFNQTQPGISSGVDGTGGILGQNNFAQTSTAQESGVVQQLLPATNPYAMPQVSSTGRGPSIQYGISSMPVVDKPGPVRITSILTPRHLSQRRVILPTMKYKPKNDSKKVAFFTDDEETPKSTCHSSQGKGYVNFHQRENPRALVIHPKEQWPLRASAEKVNEREELQDDGTVKLHSYVKANQKNNGVHGDDDQAIEKGDSYGADIEAQMPKLGRSDYYTEPRIQELAAKERAEPGFCCRVKEFVMGRHGYGSIKFLGETDVRGLDLESVVQFNDKEVIVYSDGSKKPPVGHGLNKAAEVTLANIKCIERKTGIQYTEGPKVEKYKGMLEKKAEEQGAKFVSFDAKKEEWTFMVNHF